MSVAEPQYINQIQKYSRYVRRKPEVVDFVLSQHSRIQSRESAITTYVVLVNPYRDPDVMGMIELVWALAPNFEELAKTFIRSGCFPLGIVDLSSNWCEAFIDLAPEDCREALAIFATVIFQKVLSEYDLHAV